MGSGVIYAAIIVMWAAYFIPRWLRRHEELSESRSVEKFDHAMRILSRKETLPDQRYVVMPPRPEEPVADRVNRRAGRGWRRHHRRHDRPARTPANLAVRRARVLAGLLVATLLTWALVPFTALPWWAGLVMVALVALDLAHLRLQARRRSELTRTRQAVRSRTRSRLRRFDSAERIVEAQATIAAERAAAEDRRRAEEAVRLAAERAEAERLAAEAAGWQPVPVPLPTYVTKPVAAPSAGTRAPLVTDEPFDQTWAPEPAGAEPVVERRGLLDDAEHAAEDLDAILERRRAVND